MEEIQHSHVQVRGVKLHVAQIGTGPKVVVFLHGFPEIWYSWRQQMIAVAKAGYRAIAIDFRGYGLSDHSPEPEKTTFKNMPDLIFQAFLVGKDAGVFPAYILCASCPEKVSGIITMGVPFLLPGPSIQIITDNLPKGFYTLRWKEPGRAEADFGRFDAKTVIRNIYILFSGSELQIAADDKEIMDFVDPSTPLPPWFSEEDLSVYAGLYENSGFRTAFKGPLQSMETDCGITDPKITAPALLIMGEKDYVLKLPGMEDFVRSRQVKHFMPIWKSSSWQKGTTLFKNNFQSR
ncbi:hypothetical protein LWI28_003391 [Acer negundo]|uniref:AB hydrolase-1 domain-containing protein n=1 Tax=Acer negundo TaxID=4023 RepID=A0AAD5ISG7_ACENE|nr:hypothetical protein LWI28_003391 [Acer negundo]KAK4845751.1 hypothetical protein QYF36_008669 [Acer negundo]